MIELNQENYNYLSMEFNLSLHNLLKESFSECLSSYYNNDDGGISYKPYSYELEIQTQVGNQYLDAL